MRQMCRTRLAPLLSLIALGLTAPRARADEPCPPNNVTGFRRPANGKVREKAVGQPTDFRIDWTDRSGAQIGVGSVTLSANQRVGTSNIFLSNVIDAPLSLNSGGQRVIVCDFTQTTTRVGHTGEVNVLSVEAPTLDPVTGQFGTASIFDVLLALAGNGVEVPIPDLYADTNLDGTLGAGDVLYSAVNLYTFLASTPTFTLGQSFTITGGLVAGLPGMFFSSTPVSLDPATGEFTGTPITTDAMALSAHLPQGTVPEPSTLALLAGGVVLLLSRRRRWRNVTSRGK
jgi:hypothetical protein